jgi:Transglycosylase SLT domain
MARLIASCFVTVLLFVTPARAGPIDRWQPYIAEASQRFGIPEDWIVRVRSRVGAMGLMQIMPGTWTGLTAHYGLGSNPDDPRANILGGTAYLREMYDQFGYPGLFAAYNAGPGRYAAYRDGRSRLPRETVAYVASITRSSPPAPVAPATHIQNDTQLATILPPPTLFFAVKSHPLSASNSPDLSPSSTLFVNLKSAQREAK